MVTLIACCSTLTKSHDIVGRYSTLKPTLWQKLQVNNHYSVGEVVIFKKDSTYTDSICGNGMTGKYDVSNDTIWMKCNNNNFINDSLNRIKKPKIGTDWEFFLIEGNKIKQTIPSAKLKGNIIRQLAKN